MRQGKAQKLREDTFSTDIETLFDIAHAESASMLKVEEDRMFLCDQRGHRQMAIGCEDVGFRLKSERAAKRRYQQEQRNMAAIAYSSNQQSIVFSSSTDDTSSDDSEPESPAKVTSYHWNQLVPSQEIGNEGPSSVDCSSKKRCLLTDSLFLASLDRTKTSLRQAMHVVTPALTATGVDVNALTFSRTSLHRSRISGRETISNEIKKLFRPEVPLLLHFDGKLLPSRDGGKTDRLAIVVTGAGIEKLLGIPKIPNGKGPVMANMVNEFVDKWPGVDRCLAALCFDTTASNTGIHTGAITELQRVHPSRLLFLACRHHMLEIVAAAVFDIFFTSSGPDIRLFARFKEFWPSIDQNVCQAIDSDSDGVGALTQSESVWLEATRVPTIALLEKQLSEFQPRHDYGEFIQLALLLWYKSCMSQN